jgi:diguanylate cyclase (GGDEF)-like protein
MTEMSQICAPLKPGPIPAGTPRECERPWRILELFAHNAGIEEVLDEVLLLVREAHKLNCCAILVLADNKLQCMASVGLPQGILAAMDLASPADCENGACAAPWGHFTPGFVDFTTGPARDPWASMALAAGLRGCRREPIITGFGEVLGEVLAFIHREESPESVNLAGLRLAARVSRNAIEQRQMMSDLLHHAHHDPVTLLPNRWLFEERLEQAIAHSDRSHVGAALLHIDLDRFHIVNDLLGRGVGDLLLERVARLMGEALRNGDMLARIAGDGLSALLSGVRDTEAAIQAAERFRERLTAPIEVSGHELTVTASIGCALYPEHASDGLALQRCAEAALQRAKQSGRNCVRSYIPARDGSTQHRARLESDLRRALSNSELRLVYQPQVDFATRRLTGAEALVRWQHPEIGKVSPAAFIPIAEETGLILPIGEWVLREACRELARWRKLGSNARMAVNVSAAQLARDGFIDIVKGELEQHRLPPESLELELTESALLHDPESAIGVMRELKLLGVALAFDDFGTGYSSLSMLERLPIDVIKIDASFVRQIPVDGHSPMIETIVSMAREMRKTLIAEGVETEAQHAYLASLRCDIAQGYLHGKPTPAEEFRALWISPPAV